MNRTAPLTPRFRRQAGFTLAETLVAGVLGAMLLTAVAYASFEFAYGVAYLEEKAGINADEDSAMRQMVRDIREAWYAELVDPSHIRLANPDEEFMEYYLEDEKVKLRRPNGDVGNVAFSATALVFEPSYITRYREGDKTAHYGAWYQRTESGWHTNLEVESGDKAAFAFVTPYHEEDLPAGTGLDEHLSTLELDVLDIPVAFIPGTAPEGMLVELFEARAPGSARPRGSAIASLTFEGTALPQAVWDDDDWADVEDGFALDLSSLGADLVPGDAYTLRLSPTGDAGLLFKAYPEMVDSDDDDVAYQDSTGSNYVTLPLSVPMSLSGDYVLSTTTEHEVISALSVTLSLAGRPVQTRSAALISQAISDDPWFGVVPGDPAP